MVTTNADVLAPKVLIAPTGACHLNTKAPVGSLQISGAKLYVAVTEGVFQLVTSS